MPAVAAERPEKPKNPATREITKKIIAHFSIAFLPSHVPAPVRDQLYCDGYPGSSDSEGLCLCTRPRGLPQAAALASPDIADLSCCRARCTRLFKVPIAQPLVSDTSS